MIKLSVIIPTRNRAKILSNALASIEEQTLDQDLFEVIVCDNNSTDTTGEIAHSFIHKFKNFRYIKTFEPGLHIGRNKGFQEAKGEILVYIDDDIEALPDWLLTINKVFEDKNVVLVGGKNLPKWEIPPPDWALEMWAPDQNSNRISGCFSLIDLGDQIKEINSYYVFGCNFSVRKNIIAEMGGFHPDGMPQEMIEYRGDGETAISAYIEQKKYKTIYHPKASVYHLVPKERLSIDYLWKRGFNQGISDSYTQIRNPKPIFKKVLHNLIRFLKKKPEERINIYNKALTDGHKEGYNFHQQKVKTDPKLKIWVMKDNYL